LAAGDNCQPSGGLTNLVRLTFVLGELLLQILLRQRNAQKRSDGNFEGSATNRTDSFGWELADPFSHSQIAFGWHVSFRV
jgi:hypothetical protein